MTSTQYRTALWALGLTQLSAAHFLGVSVRTSHSYANGRPIPVAVGKLLTLMRLTGQKPIGFDHHYDQFYDQTQVEHEVDR